MVKYHTQNVRSLALSKIFIAVFICQYRAAALWNVKLYVYNFRFAVCMLFYPRNHRIIGRYLVQLVSFQPFLAFYRLHI